MQPPMGWTVREHANTIEVAFAKGDIHWRKLFKMWREKSFT